ncbi:MAG: WecB/TagA/CpsF family glycosyltransferase, partial [Candidatus Cloacimonetes bacterium]|nr:WecB/TagA/CpsF family glycosyltransferase [Candidatus Cloacimonadota bacterium]
MSTIFVSGFAYDRGKSGISDYNNNVLKNMSAESEVHLIMSDKDRKAFPVQAPRIHFIKAPTFVHPVMEMSCHLFILPFSRDFTSYDLVFLPAGNRRLFCLYPANTVVTIHDLSQFHIPAKYDALRMFYITRVVPFFLKYAPRIIAISKSTRADLQKYYHIPVEKITLNYNGFDSGLYCPAGETDLPEDYPAEFFLYLARIEHPGKNHLNLIKAYEKLPDEVKQQYALLLPGKVWSGSEVVTDYLEQSSDRERIFLPGFIPTRLMSVLYRRAKLYVFPSLFEGFGIPLLEAMASGVPVLCSDCSSLPEVGGDAVQTFNPKNSDEIAEKISALLGDEKRQKEMIAKGLTRVKHFDWAKHAAIVRDVALTRDASPRKKLEPVDSWRFLEIVVSLVLMPILAGATLAILLSRRNNKVSLFTTKDYVGRNGRKLTLNKFKTGIRLIDSLPTLPNILKGDVGTVGIALREWNEENRQEVLAELAHARPGIISLWFVRSSARIAHESRLATDKEYLVRAGFVRNSMLLLQAIPALFYRHGTTDFRETINLLGLDFLNPDMKEAVRIIDDAVAKQQQTNIYFVNPDCFNKTFDDRIYYDILKNTRVVFPDGIGVNIACKLIGKPLRENVNGTDMMPFTCNLCVEKGYSMYLLGAAPGVAEIMRQRLEKKYPGLKIAGVQNGFFDWEKDSADIVSWINESRTDILLVAFGAPKQEKWIDRYGEKIKCPVKIGVGGLFDFYSETKKRAPRWMRDVGLE